MTRLITVLVALGIRLRDELGFSTAELLGNAALGVIALIAIWGALQVLGVDVVNWIRGAILSGSAG
jgi:hypothetical protein